MLLAQHTAMQWMDLHITISSAVQLYCPLYQLSHISNRISQ